MSNLTSNPTRTNSTRIAIIERYFNELFNEGRVELVDELLHPDYVNHSPGSPDQPRDRAAVRDVVKMLRTAFPDLHYTIEEMVCGDEAIAVRATMRGTHRGHFFGLAPTGRTFSVQQITIERFDGERFEGERFAGDRIIAHHRVTDMHGLLAQLTNA